MSIQNQEYQETKNLRISHRNHHLLHGLGDGEHHHFLDEIPFESPEDSEHFMQIRKRKEELHTSLLKEHQKYHQHASIVQDITVDIPASLEGHVRLSLPSWFHQGPLSSSSSIMALICTGILFYLIYSKTFKPKTSFSAMLLHKYKKKSLIRLDSCHRWTLWCIGRCGVLRIVTTSEREYHKE
jgi:hypothetical protein